MNRGCRRWYGRFLLGGWWLCALIAPAQGAPVTVQPGGEAGYLYFPAPASGATGSGAANAGAGSVVTLLPVTDPGVSFSICLTASGSYDPRALGWLDANIPRYKLQVITVGGGGGSGSGWGTGAVGGQTTFSYNGFTRRVGGGGGAGWLWGGGGSVNGKPSHTVFAGTRQICDVCNPYNLYEQRPGEGASIDWSGAQFQIACDYPEPNAGTGYLGAAGGTGYGAGAGGGRWGGRNGSGGGAGWFALDVLDYETGPIRVTVGAGGWRGDEYGAVGAPGVVKLRFLPWPN